MSTPRAVMVTKRVSPAGTAGKVQLSVPPSALTAGTLVQVPPAWTVCDWNDRLVAGIWSVITRFSAAEGPLLVATTV